MKHMFLMYAKNIKNTYFFKSYPRAALTFYFIHT